MTPEQLEQFNKMQADIKKLMDVLDVTFIENAKRRIATPAILDFSPLKKESAGGTTGTLKVVSEAGSSSYSVADAYDGVLTVKDPAGNTYKIGYYN